MSNTQKNKIERALKNLDLEVRKYGAFIKEKAKEFDVSVKIDLSDKIKKSSKAITESKESFRNAIHELWENEQVDNDDIKDYVDKMLKVLSSQEAATIETRAILLEKLGELYDETNATANRSKKFSESYQIAEVENEIDKNDESKAIVELEISQLKLEVIKYKSIKPSLEKSTHIIPEVLDFMKENKYQKAIEAILPFLKGENKAQFEELEQQFIDLNNNIELKLNDRLEWETKKNKMCRAIIDLFFSHLEVQIDKWLPNRDDIERGVSTSRIKSIRNNILNGELKKALHDLEDLSKKSKQIDNYKEFILQHSLFRQLESAEMAGVLSYIEYQYDRFDWKRRILKRLRTIEFDLKKDNERASNLRLQQIQSMMSNRQFPEALSTIESIRAFVSPDTQDTLDAVSATIKRLDKDFNGKANIYPKIKEQIETLSNTLSKELI